MTCEERFKEKAVALGLCFSSESLHQQPQPFQLWVTRIIKLLIYLLIFHLFPLFLQLFSSSIVFQVAPCFLQFRIFPSGLMLSFAGLSHLWNAASSASELNSPSIWYRQWRGAKPTGNVAFKSPQTNKPKLEKQNQRLIHNMYRVTEPYNLLSWKGPLKIN